MKKQLLQLGMLGGVIAAILIFRAIGFIQPIEAGVVSSMSALFSKGMSIKTALLSFQSNFDTGSEMYEKLQSELRTAQREYSSCKQLEAENALLRKALDFKRQTPFRSKPAHSIGTSVDRGSHMLILDKGSDDGVIKGSAVVADDGVFVGTLSVVQPRISFLLLPNDDRSSILISIFKNGHELSGIAHGTFRIGIRIEKMQQGIELESGDTVVTSALNADIPPGLLLGTIREVTSSAHDVFQTATVDPAIVYETVRIVSIVSIN